jgi:hypothetical protein
MQKLPVFFHIPKNAGTYTYNLAFQLVRFRLLSDDTILNIIVKKGDHILYRVVCSAKNRPLSGKYKKIVPSKVAFFVDPDDFNIDDLNLYFVEVCGRSFGSYKDYIYKNLPRNLKPYEFMFLREPYGRTLSLFSYLRSPQSAHEPSHKVYDSNTFIEHLNSPQLQGSWLIHNLLNVPDPEIITQDHYEQTCNILDEMLVSDMSGVDDAIVKIFNECYNLGLDIKSFLNKRITRNLRSNTTKDKLEYPFESLDEETKTHFLNQTKWDKLLYDKYTK